MEIRHSYPTYPFIPATLDQFTFYLFAENVRSLAGSRNGSILWVDEYRVFNSAVAEEPRNRKQRSLSIS